MNGQKINKLFESELDVLNMGLESFSETLSERGVRSTQIDWTPPAGGKADLIEALDFLETRKEDIDKANAKALEIIQKGKPEIVDIQIAGEVIPGMTAKTVLHAGPPVTWEKMCGPMKGAVIGGLIFEGLAANREEAETMAASGEILFDPCHHHSTVGPMAGIVTASMPVWVLKNSVYGNTAFATLNEGLGKVLRYGAFSDEVIDKLRWMRDELAPILKKALALHGPVDMKTLISQVLQMGDEGHNRNRAGTSLFIREMAAHLVMLDEDKEKIAKVFNFMHQNDHFFLNLTMPTCKCLIDAARDIENSSLIVTQARNGTEFGIQVSGLGSMWFTGPASKVDGLYLPGYTEEDAGLDIGDSTITETVGIGGFAMAAAPAIVKFVGGSPDDAMKFTQDMYEITMGENSVFQIPALDFRGTPTGIDLMKIAETGIYPVINTGIAHKDPGIGMVGAGLVKPPVNCYEDALKAFKEALDKN
ncbi:DUF1116 domain-containing protein [Spirochaeta isovalerica]|uniref:DUF1116 domain-containing protein n=1 Tax=Spirochaeta isovalerica TaxID=150 RepID=A0A841RAW6_9SPIO|nr:DUF1116 domain-containing protein [Spirochaeta isovalerica]MBB6479572.1 hypothetical protein [Spirochaeta isovalerica]